MTDSECYTRKDADKLESPYSNTKNKRSEKKIPYGESLKELTLSLEEEGGGHMLSSPLKVALRMVVINVLSLLGREYRKVFS